MAVEPSLLKDILIFRDLTDEELVQIAGITEDFTLPGNRILFNQSDEADSFYIILEGEVDVRKNLGTKEQKIANMSKGAIIGEMAFLTETRRTGTIKTITKVRFLKILKDEFKTLLLEENSIAAYKIVYRLAQILSFRLARISEQFVDYLNTNKVPEKEKEGFLENIKKIFL
ncbi:MAG: DNA-binding transcriptional dual regulator Crp [bacterium ADurb.Bin363]|nr:MAG: DNA-binding transcriptional dual regulator Crp [bacterium ADurb.Bin363]